MPVFSASDGERRVVAQVIGYVLGHQSGRARLKLAAMTDSVEEIVSMTHP
jgi:hypothetical protein